MTPEICAPVRPSIPFGFSTKLMIGREISSPSRTIANEPENWSASLALAAAGGWPVAAKYASDPRRAMSEVTLANASRPSSVKLKSTVGWLNWSVPGFGSVIWSPVRPGLSCRTKNCEPTSDSSMSWVEGSSSGLSSSTTVPRGTARTLVPGGCFSLGEFANRSSLTSEGSPMGSSVFASKR